MTSWSPLWNYDDMPMLIEFRFKIEPQTFHVLSGTGKPIRSYSILDDRTVFRQNFSVENGRQLLEDEPAVAALSLSFGIESGRLMKAAGNAPVVMRHIAESHTAFIAMIEAFQKKSP